jgi:hypothetical protein
MGTLPTASPVGSSRIAVARTEIKLMILKPRLRQAAFLTHVTCSVGWLGAIVAYLALAVAGLGTQDVLLARSAYLSMELVGWCVIVPLSLAALASGLVQSLGTEWGLFVHYWIAVKFLAASASSLVLLVHMRVVSQMSGVARAATFTTDDFGGLRIQLVVHAVGGLLILLGATALSIYKPWGLTRYGRRQQEDRADSTQKRDQSQTAGPGRGLYLLFGALGIILFFLILHHLLGGGLRHH